MTEHKAPKKPVLKKFRPKIIDIPSTSDETPPKIDAHESTDIIDDSTDSIESQPKKTNKQKIHTKPTRKIPPPKEVTNSDSDSNQEDDDSDIVVPPKPTLSKHKTPAILKDFSDSDNSNDDIPQKPKLKSTTNKTVTYEEFNSYALEEQQKLIKQLTKATSKKQIIKRLNSISDILTFLSKIGFSSSSSEIFKLSIDNPDLNMSTETIKKLNSFIPHKTIKKVTKSDQLDEFFELLKEFTEVTIELIIKATSSKIYRTVHSKLSKLNEDGYGQFFINLTIDGPAEIEDSAFADQVFISSLVLSSSVEAVGKHSFIGCTSLKKVTFSDEITSIGVASFQKCSSLEAVSIPDSVTNLLEFCFSRCSSLKSVTLPSNLNGLKTGVFDRCKSLQNIKIPPTVVFIGKDCFNDCSSLKRIDIPSVQRINDFAFANCTSLERIKVSSSVHYGTDPFKNCPMLKNKPDTGSSHRGRGGRGGRRGRGRGGYGRGGGKHQSNKDEDEDESDDFS